MKEKFVTRDDKRFRRTDAGGPYGARVSIYDMASRMDGSRTHDGHVMALQELKIGESTQDWAGDEWERVV